MKISRKTRTQYELDEFTSNEQGDINFGGEVYNVRLFIKKVNEHKNLISYPELALSVGKFNAAALLSEITNKIIDKYTNLKEKPELFKNLSKNITDKVGLEKLNNATQFLIDEFPPEIIYKEKQDTKEFLKKQASDSENQGKFFKEFLTLWLQNNNPAFSPYLEFFDDTILEKNTAYNEIVDVIVDYFEQELIIPSKNQNLIEFLMVPFKKHPYSIKEQLEYIQEHWSDLIGDYAYRILLALDLIREEEMMRGLGPGESQVLEYDLLEYENFTPDKDWMPRVVMIAKNIYVWLDQLSKQYNRPIRKLHEIPDEELNKIKSWGFNAIWVIGIWERSLASKTIKQWCGNPEAEASAYSIYDYNISFDLGGYESFKNLKERAWSRGIRLGSDMVPNHMGIVSKWTLEHPDWFISLPYPPFPSYSYSGHSVSNNNDIGVYLEDKYFSRSDAAVTFKRVDFHTGDTRYIYHGNDGTSFPWNDTAQLNFLIPEVREAVIQNILNVSKNFSIIRFDAAMTLTRRHYQRLWFPEPGTGGAIPSRAEHGISREDFFNAMPNEFWREVVDRVSQENPDTLLLAEAFWLLEGFFVRTLGMHRVYNSAFMNMLRDEDNMKYRAVMKNTLEFDPEILKRFVNFMNNPDEETAIKQFGDGDKYFGICAMMVTMPGLPMFGHGQVEGYYEKYGMEYNKAYWDEKVNEGLLNYHNTTIFRIMKRRYLFADVKYFLLYDFWTGNIVNEDVFAYSNRFGDERCLVIYNNKFAETKGFIKNSVGYAEKEVEDKIIRQNVLSEGLKLPREGYCIFKDYMTGLEFIRRNNDLTDEGLYIELHAYQSHVFMDFRIVQDDEFFHYAQLYEFLRGNGVQNIDETLKDVIYKPIHEPIEELINGTTYLNLLNIKSRDKILAKIDSKLILLLNEIKKYTQGNSDIKKIKEDIIRSITSILTWKQRLIEQNVDENIINSLEKLLPSSNVDWGILFSWQITHLLGTIVSDSNYELRSRSWIDEWRISRYIQNTLQNLAIDKTKDAFNLVLLIKLLISHQNCYNSKEVNERTITRNLLTALADSEVQQFLNFNRYQDTLWYRAESFEALMRWLSIISISKLLKVVNSENLQKIDEIIRCYSYFIEASNKSNFKVDNLFSYLNSKV